MGSRAISYQVPEYRERSTKGTVGSGSRCCNPPQAAATRKMLAIQSDWKVFMKDLGAFHRLGQRRSGVNRHNGSLNGSKCPLLLFIMCKVVNHHALCYGWVVVVRASRRAGLRGRSATSMLPCPRILSEVRPKSPHCPRLRPAPSPVPRVQDNVTFIRRNPTWVRSFTSVGCPIRRPSSS